MPQCVFQLENFREIFLRILSLACARACARVPLVLENPGLQEYARARTPRVRARACSPGAQEPWVTRARANNRRARE